MRYTLGLVIFYTVLFTACNSDQTSIKRGTNEEAYVLICQSKDAKRYHKYECWGLKECSHAIIKVNLQEAQKLGRTPCKICY